MNWLQIQQEDVLNEQTSELFGFEPLEKKRKVYNPQGLPPQPSRFSLSWAIPERSQQFDQEAPSDNLLLDSGVDQLDSALQLFRSSVQSKVKHQVYQPQPAAPVPSVIENKPLLQLNLQPKSPAFTPLAKKTQPIAAPIPKPARPGCLSLVKQPTQIPESDKLPAISITKQSITIQQQSKLRLQLSSKEKSRPSEVPDRKQEKQIQPIASVSKQASSVKLQLSVSKQAPKIEKPVFKLSLNNQQQCSKANVVQKPQSKRISYVPPNQPVKLPITLRVSDIASSKFNLGAKEKAEPPKGKGAFAMKSLVSTLREPSLIAEPKPKVNTTECMEQLGSCLRRILTLKVRIADLFEQVRAGRTNLK